MASTSSTAAATHLIESLGELGWLREVLSETVMDQDSESDSSVNDSEK